jgi:hypothetical protein
MIYTFKSRATADLKMTGPVGDRVLSLIGKPLTAQGIIDVDQLPAALQALEAAVADERDHPPMKSGHDDDEHHGAATDQVSLRQRVWPMVEMMKASLAEGFPIVWGV